LTSRPYLLSTMGISVLVLAASAAGVLISGTYARETTDWALQARAQDLADVVAVAALLVAAFTARERSTRGLLVWAGCLLYLIYAFFIYAFALHYNSLFLLYVATLGLLVYTFLGGVLRLDFDELRGYVRVGVGTRRWVGVLLLVLALLFYALWLSEDVPALLSGAVPTTVTREGVLVNPVHVLDIGLFLPALILTGLSLLRDRSLGYVFALPLLTFATLTGFGILVIDVLTSANGTAVDPVQEIFVSVISVVSLVSAAAYLRGVSGGSTEGPQLPS
jgi:hypothetical protein